MGERLIAVQCAGGIDGYWFIVGMLSPVNMASLYAELRRMNNVQTNEHHQMLKPSLNLKAHYEPLQTTMASLREAVVVTDAVGGVIFMNAAAQALTGLEPLAAQGRAVEDVVRLVASRDTQPPPRGAASYPDDHGR